MKRLKDLNKEIKIVFIILISFFLVNKTVIAIEQFTAHGGPVKI